MADGPIAGIFNLLAAGKKEEAAKKFAGLAEEERNKYMTLINGMDWDADQVSNHVGTFQRSRSPLADAWLQSYLTGDNPDAVSSVKPNAAGFKQAATNRFNARTGGWDSLYQQQRDMEASTPWEVPETFSAGDEDADAEVSTDPLSKSEREHFRDITGGALIDSSGKWLGRTPGSDDNVASYRPTMNLQYDSHGAQGNKVYSTGSPDYLARVRRYMALVDQGMDPSSAAVASLDESFHFTPPDEETA